jgi:hypothetical protein
MTPKLALLLLLGGTALAQNPPALDCSNPKKNTVPCYITEVRKVLLKYRTDVGKQIQRQETYHASVAQVAAQGRRDEIDGELRYQRARRSERLAAEFIEGRTPVSIWKDALIDYADLDSRRMRELFIQDTTDGSQLLAGIESLKFDAARVDALDKLLKGLQEPDSLSTQVQLLGKFAADTRGEFDKKVCAALKTELAAVTKQAAALAAEIAALPAGAATLAAKQGELKIANASKAALTKQRTAMACKD